MVSFIITSYNEPRTIGKVITCLLDREYSGLDRTCELITVIPDEPTIAAAKKALQKFPKLKWVHIKDPRKGKPYALNLALAKAQGEIIIATDGEVFFAKDAVKFLLAAFADPKVGAATGRPVSADGKGNFMGYIGHLLADAAHHKRTVTMTEDPTGNSLKFMSKAPNFFVLSGYILAMRNFHFTVPDDCLIEDAYLSYAIHNHGYKLKYVPDAKVFVKYAQTISDWYKQKLRSVGGYVQLWKYGVIKVDTKVRNFWKELEYFWFPLKYASNLSEFFWSILLYPMRLMLWLRIFYEQRVLKKDLAATWVRIESTK